MKSYNVVPEWTEDQSVVVQSVDERVVLSDGSEVVLRAKSGHPNLFEIVVGEKSYDAIIRTNSRGQVEISYQGYMYSLKVSDAAYDRFASILKESSATVATKTRVQAPMPGLLKHVSVHNGQAVRKGEKLFVLEAMKMENIIKSPASGIVQNLSYDEGAAVDKGSVLCVVEPQSVA